MSKMMVKIIREGDEISLEREVNSALEEMVNKGYTLADYIPREHEEWFIVHLIFKMSLITYAKNDLSKDSMDAMTNFRKEYQNNPYGKPRNAYDASKFKDK